MLGLRHTRVIALLHHIEKNGPILRLDELRIIPQIAPIEEVGPRLRSGRGAPTSARSSAA